MVSPDEYDELSADPVPEEEQTPNRQHRETTRSRPREQRVQPDQRSPPARVDWKPAYQERYKDLDKSRYRIKSWLSARRAMFDEHQQARARKLLKSDRDLAEMTDDFLDEYNGNFYAAALESFKQSRIPAPPGKDGWTRKMVEDFDKFGASAFTKPSGGVRTPQVEIESGDESSDESGDESSDESSEESESESDELDDILDDLFNDDEPPESGSDRSSRDSSDYDDTPSAAGPASGAGFPPPKTAGVVGTSDPSRDEESDDYDERYEEFERLKAERAAEMKAQKEAEQIKQRKSRRAYLKSVQNGVQAGRDAYDPLLTYQDRRKARKILRGRRRIKPDEGYDSRRLARKAEKDDIRRNALAAYGPGTVYRDRTRASRLERNRRKALGVRFDTRTHRTRTSRLDRSKIEDDGVGPRRVEIESSDGSSEEDGSNNESWLNRPPDSPVNDGWDGWFGGSAGGDTSGEGSGEEFGNESSDESESESDELDDEVLNGILDDLYNDDEPPKPEVIVISDDDSDDDPLPVGKYRPRKPEGGFSPSAAGPASGPGSEDSDTGDVVQTSDPSREMCAMKIAEYHRWLSKQDRNVLYNAIANKQNDQELRECLMSELKRRAKAIVPDENFDDISLQQVQALYDIVDTIYYNGLLVQKCPLPPAPLTAKEQLRARDTQNMTTFKFVDKRAKKGGHCMWIPRSQHIEIAMHKEMFLNIPVKDGVMEPRVSNGIPCSSRLECFLNVLLHESVHALINCTCSIPRKERPSALGSHGKVFQAVAKVLFGHTDFRHELSRPFDPSKHLVTQQEVQAIIKHNKNLPSFKRHVIKYVDKNRGISYLYPIRANPKTVSATLSPSKGAKSYKIPYRVITIVGPEHRIYPVQYK